MISDPGKPAYEEERRKDEFRIRESEANLKAIIENSLESIWSVDTSYRIQYVNAVFANSFEATFGVRLVKGANILEALPEPLRGLWKERYDRAFNNEHFFFSDRVETGGRVIYIEVAMNPILVDGKVVGASFYGKDVTEQKVAEEQAREREINYESLFNTVRQAIYIQNPDSTFIDVNQGALDMYGYDREFFHGKTPEVLSAPGMNDLEQVAGYARLAFEGIPQKFEFWGLKKDGTVFPKDVWTIKGKYNGKEVLISLANDITDRKNYEELLIRQNRQLEEQAEEARQLNEVLREAILDLEKAKEKAEESNRLKSAFLANMSHEIRTPMNGILGFLELLQEIDITHEEQQKYIALVNNSGQRLLRTINDIIEMSKIEAGQVEPVTREVNLSGMMLESYQFFKPRIEEKGVSFNYVEKITGREALVQTDKHKLEGILINLINNALKFTQQGSIEFGNYTEGDSMVFYVRDTGMGIPAEHQPAIFERFSRGDANLTRSFEGSGLGLSIAKAYAELLGGRIWFESAEGRGSTFWFSLPYLPSHSFIPNKN